MNKNGGSIIIGLGIASMLSGVYWIYKGGEILEIIPPFIIGIGLIGTVLLNKDKKK
jgi:hypothetical protein